MHLGMTGFGSLSGPRMSLSSEYNFPITQWLPCYWNVTCSLNNWSILVLPNASHRSLVINLRLSIHRCLIWNYTWFHSTKANLEAMSHIERGTSRPRHRLHQLARGSPYLVLTGELWGFYCEYFEDFFREISRVQCMHCIRYYLWHTYCFFIFCFCVYWLYFGQ